MITLVSNEVRMSMRLILLNLTLSITLTLFMSIDAFANPQVHGIMRVVKGDVQVKSGKNDAISRARIGGKVFPKDTIITGKDSRVKIVMIDNNEINISPDSQIQIENYEYKSDGEKKNVMLNVIYGKVRNKVEQKYDGEASTFQVKTPSAVAGVRGTDFLTGFSRATRKTEVVTFEGKVMFGMVGPRGNMVNPVPVSAGMMTSQAAGQPPTPPIQVPQTELAKMDNSSNADTAVAGGDQSPKERAPAAEEKQEEKPAAEPAPANEAPKKEEPQKSEASPNGSAANEPAPADKKPAPGAPAPGDNKNAGPASPGNGPNGPAPAAGGPPAPGSNAMSPGGPGPGPAAGGPNGPAPVAGPPMSTGGPRGPASISMPAMGSMFNASKDLPSNNLVISPMLNLPQMPVAPTQAMQPRPQDFLQNCVQCREAVTNGPARVIIRVNQ